MRMRGFASIAVAASSLLLGQGAAAGTTPPQESTETWSLSGADEKIMVQTSIGLPVVLERPDAAARSTSNIEQEAEDRAAYLTRHLDGESIEILSRGTGPRIMTWDIDGDAITDVSYRERNEVLEPLNDVQPMAGVLGRSSGCTDSTSTSSCLFHRSGNTSRLTGTNGTSTYTFLNVNMFAGPRDLTSRICAGSTNDCQGLPADYAVSFVQPSTVYSVTHY